MRTYFPADACSTHDTSENLLLRSTEYIKTLSFKIWLYSTVSIFATNVQRSSGSSRLCITPRQYCFHLATDKRTVSQNQHIFFVLVCWQYQYCTVRSSSRASVEQSFPILKVLRTTAAIGSLQLQYGLPGSSKSCASAELWVSTLWRNRSVKGSGDTAAQICTMPMPPPMPNAVAATFALLVAA